MNYKNKFSAFLVLLSLAFPALAEYQPLDKSKTADQGQGMKGMQSMKGMQGMEMSEEMKDKHARERQQYILKIDALSDEIRAEKDPAKKQTLMDEQLQLIKDHQEKRRQMKKKMMKKHHQMMMKQKSMEM